MCCYEITVNPHILITSLSSFPALGIVVREVIAVELKKTLSLSEQCLYVKAFPYVQKKDYPVALLKGHHLRM